MSRETTIYFPGELRERWPVPLADEWRASYPNIFDDDDLRLAKSQPENHFCEWLAAIHLFHRDGVYALVEKYAYENHARKVRLLNELLPPQHQEFLRSFRDRLGVQPPDLLLFRPDRSAYWFAEVKGPGDRLLDRQRESHERIATTLGVDVELIAVDISRAHRAPWESSRRRTGSEWSGRPSTRSRAKR